MTSIVGVLCTDGIVVGSDSSATFAHGTTTTIEQPIPKIAIIDGHVIVAGSGYVGMNQRFCDNVEKAWDWQGDPQSKLSWEKNGGRPERPLDFGRLCCRLMMLDYNSTGTADRAGEYTALVAFPEKDMRMPHLCEFSGDRFQPELKTKDMWYVSIGSAQPITDAFLGFIRNVFWEDGRRPNVREGIFALTWTLQQALELNTGGVKGPIQMAVLESVGKYHKLKARQLGKGEIAEHEQNVKGAKDHLREYRDKLQAKESAPEIPEPDKG